MRSLLLGAMASAAALTGFSHAAPFLDLTSDDVFTGGPASGTVADLGGFEVRISSSAATNQGDGISNKGFCDEGPVFACDFDGIGIGSDEITVSSTSASQTVTIEFLTGPVLISEVFYLDLFSTNSGTETAVATTSIGGAFVQEIFTAATSSNQPGFASETGSLATAVDKIVFAASLINGRDDSTSDYALAGLSFAAVPDNFGDVPLPAAAPLFGAGLLGLRLLRRGRHSRLPSKA